MSTALVPIEALGAEIKARIEAGDRALDKAEQHYISAGLQLAQAKERVRHTANLTWPAFLSTYCGVRRRRADELIALADGRTTLAEMREKNRDRVAAHRDRKKAEPALRNAELPEQDVVSGAVAKPDGDADLRAIIDRQAREIEALKRKLAKAEETIQIKEGQRHAQEALANAADRQAKDAAARAMYAEADKERLAEELEQVKGGMIASYLRGQELWGKRKVHQGQAWHRRVIAKAKAEASMITADDLAAILSLAGFSRMTQLMEHDFNVHTYGTRTSDDPLPEFKWRREFAPIKARAA